MRKLVLIGIAFFGMMIVSCEKQDIQPNTANESATPEWRKTSDDTHGGDVVTVGGGITDPNDDEDGHGRKKN